MIDLFVLIVVSQFKCIFQNQNKSFSDLDPHRVTLDEDIGESGWGGRCVEKLKLSLMCG